MNAEVRPLTERQLEQLTRAFHRGAAESSSALGGWLSAETRVSIDSVDQCLLEQATGVLARSDEPVCMCVMQMEGTLQGQMLLAFDDVSGWSMADLLLGRDAGSSCEWCELEISSALETMNIAGSAYLNGIARDLSERGSEGVSLIPTPPVFLRDFAESLLEAAFLEQAATGRFVVFAKANFELQGKPLHWTFLLVPDPESLQRLTMILSGLP